MGICRSAESNWLVTDTLGQIWKSGDFIYLFANLDILFIQKFICSVDTEWRIYSESMFPIIYLLEMYLYCVLFWTFIHAFTYFNSVYCCYFYNGLGIFEDLPQNLK